MISKVKVGKEIVVIAANKPGVLSSAAKLLSDRGINVTAISAQIAGGVGLINMVVDEHVRAVDLLEKNKYMVHENPVILAEVEDRPGALKYVAGRLAANKIDILNVYGSAAETYGACLLVFSTSSNQKALVALKKN